ncbi:hypothetical protein Dimus_005783, partial [Dionaea muscipula]
LRREDGVWWIGSGENRRRDNDVAAPEGEVEEEEERNQGDFDWEAVIDEAVVEGNLARERSFMIARIRIEALEKCEEIQRRLTKFGSAKEQARRESTPRVLLGEFRSCDD